MMKKLVVAVVALVLCAAANADLINWSISGVKASSGDSVEAGQYITYIFADTDSGPDDANMFKKNPRTTIDAIVEDIKSGQYDVVRTLAFYNNNGSSTYLKTKGTANTTATDGTASFSGSAGWIGVNGKVNLFAVIFDSSSIETANNYMIAQTSDKTQTLSAGTIKNNYSSYTHNLDWGSQAEAGNSWVAIPEPTSGVLMLVGVAALALRRKRAA